MKAELPANEALRIAALQSYNILDTAPETSFDDLTLLATQICQTPIALISFIDDKRQWFKSQIGLNLTEIARDDAFCAHSLLNSDEILEVSDARLDTRFADNPLVTGDPNIVFYASVPLLTQDHCAVGTLSVYDYVPKELSSAQKQALQALARQIMTVLELGKNLINQQGQKQRERLFDCALDLYCVAGFDGYFKQVNPAWESTLGWSNKELLTRPYMDFIHPDDHEVTNDVVVTIKDGKNLLLFDNRYLCKDGSYRWFSWVAYPETEAGLIFAVARDVTSQKQAEAQLQEVTELHRAIQENAGYAIISTTTDGVFTSFNPAAERMLGYSAAELVGLKTPALIHEPSEVVARAQEFSKELGLSIEPGFAVFVAKTQQNLPNEHEWTYIRKDGTHFPVILTVTALRDDTGQINGFLGIAVDITEHRLAEEKFRLMVESTPNGLVMINKAGIINLANTQMVKLFGYTREELIGLSIEMLVPERFRASHPKHRQNFFATPEVRAMGHGRDLFGQRKDGSEFQLEIGLSSLNTPEGMFVLAAVVDITERKKMQQVLEQFKYTLDQTVDCVFICNSANFRFEYVNEGAIQQVGYSEAELLDMAVPDIKPEYSFEKYQLLIQPLLDGSQASLTFETIHKHKRGHEIPVEVTIQVVRQDFKKPRLVAVVRDISDRKQAEKMLRTKNEELKSFAYTVSHDLKAPLRGISGYAQELERRHQEGLPERAQFCIKQIITASHNLDCLIEDLLTYSRVDSETPTTTEVDISLLIKAIIRDRSLVIAEQGLELTVNVPVITLKIWERGLHQVLTNLIDNAIKYSRNAKPPRLSISAEQTATTCIITVKDNGVGFDMKYHDRIFGLFNRLVRADKFEGTGAGLAIVGKLLNKLGGSIRAESEPDKGAIFFVELPITILRESLS